MSQGVGGQTLEILAEYGVDGDLSEYLGKGNQIPLL